MQDSGEKKKATFASTVEKREYEVPEGNNLEKYKKKPKKEHDPKKLQQMLLRAQANQIKPAPMNPSSDGPGL